MTQAQSIVLASAPLHKLPKDKIVEICRSDPERAAAAIHALASFNTNDLPNTSFVRRAKSGSPGEYLTLVRVRRRIALSSEDGDLEAIKGGAQITAAGYRRLNQTIGLHIMTPQNVVVADQRQPNPYVEDDETSGRPRRVYCRKVAIGPSPETGNLVATDIMVRLDLELYFIEALTAKMRDDSSGKFVVMGSRDEHPMPDAKQGWKFIAVMQDVGIWYKVTDPKIGEVIKAQISRLKFADRIAQTVAERNAMKAHPSMPSTTRGLTISTTGVATLLIDAIGWAATASTAELEHLRTLAEEGRLHEQAEMVSAQTVEIDEVGTESDISTAREGDSDQGEYEEPQKPSTRQTVTKAAEPKPAEPAAEPEPEDGPPIEVLREDAEARAKTLGANISKIKMKEAGFAKVKDATREQLIKFLER